MGTNLSANRDQYSTYKCLNDAHIRKLTSKKPCRLVGSVHGPLTGYDSRSNTREYAYQYAKCMYSLNSF
jgi:hypothetical protein